MTKHFPALEPRKAVWQFVVWTARFEDGSERAVRRHPLDGEPLGLTGRVGIYLVQDDALYTESTIAAVQLLLPSGS